uniref:Ovule protein n=1 Tax=Heterorhabditis bacteriophora TaxID=37862 RepID=A0A1I7WGI8_HETBA
MTTFTIVISAMPALRTFNTSIHNLHYTLIFQLKYLDPEQIIFQEGLPFNCMCPKCEQTTVVSIYLYYLTYFIFMLSHTNCVRIKMLSMIKYEGTIHNDSVRQNSQQHAMFATVLFQKATLLLTKKNTER